MVCPKIEWWDWKWLIRLYHEKKKGNLPYGGGVLEQPALLMEAIEILEDIVG